MPLPAVKFYRRLPVNDFTGGKILPVSGKEAIFTGNCRIMVLDKGAILEFDSPDTLMADRNSAFAKMVADAAEQDKHE
ncbi:hypothetical protein B9Z55_021715 [Caenorhabditis nigoni]|nr:hypothetical protein B9Z55_021715 [Caenorhabditis nigoni]